MSSYEQPFSNEFSIIHATSSNLRGRIFYYLIIMAHSFVHVHPIFVLHHVVRNRTDREYRRIQINPHLQQETAYLLWQSHHINRLASRDIVALAPLIMPSGILGCMKNSALLSHCAAVQSSLRFR